MESIPLEHIATVQGSVIVHQQNVTGLHGQSRNVLFARAFNFIAIFQRQRLHGIGVKDLGHSHFGNTAGTTVAQLSGVVVGIVEPNGQSSHGVTVNGGFCLFDCLQTSGLSIHFVHHFQIHIELGGHGSIHNIFETLLDKPRQGGWHIQVTDGNANFSVVQFLQQVGIQFGQNGSTVGHQEAAAAFGSLLEAYKGGVGGGTFGGGFAVQTNVVTAQRRLVHLFVEGVPFRSKFAQARGVQRIQTGIQSQGFVHLAKSLDGFHQVKASQPNGSVFQKVGADGVLVSGKIVGAHLIILVGGSHFEGAVGLFGSLALCCFDINPLRTPSRQGAFPHSRQVGLGFVGLNEFFHGQTGAIFPFGQVPGTGRFAGGGGWWFLECGWKTSGGSGRRRRRLHHR
mmetsp:Transcript_10966/g.30317  ORF Transcript_10966/g.30317 Transcript_10966/m.30317 type:complete len:396 (+) Transcript_10966:241-1428(+)